MSLARYTKQGDKPLCFNACVSSILDVDLDKIPIHHGPGTDGWLTFIDWLHINYKLQLIIVRNSKEIREHITIHYRDIKCILIGDSPRNNADKQVLHAVVGRYDGFTFEFIHDPHDDNSYIDEIKKFLFFISSI